MAQKKNRHIDYKLESLKLKRNELKNNLLSTSDGTRNAVGTIENSLYWTQLAMGVFRTLTNYHLSPKKRFLKVGASLALVGVSKLLKEYLSTKHIDPVPDE